MGRTWPSPQAGYPAQMIRRCHHRIVQKSALRARILSSRELQENSKQSSLRPRAGIYGSGNKVDPRHHEGGHETRRASRQSVQAEPVSRPFVQETSTLHWRGVDALPKGWNEVPFWVPYSISDHQKIRSYPKRTTLQPLLRRYF